MVFKIVWSGRALEDLREIVHFISRDNPPAAQRFGERLIATAESLAVFPERGRLIPRFGDPNLREVFLGPYRIAYRLRPGSAPVVQIARIWHGARSEESFTIE